MKMKNFNKITAFIFVFHFLLMDAQQNNRTGINTTNPKASLDIQSQTTDNVQGLLIPRLTGDEIKTMTANLNADQNSMLVYATAAVTTSDAPTEKIAYPGYFKFIYDASTNPATKSWISMEPTGLERVKEASKVGWKLIGSGRDFYISPDYMSRGNLGYHAVDLSYVPNVNSFPSQFDYIADIPLLSFLNLIRFNNANKIGAEGNASFVSGFANKASGDASVAMGIGTRAIGKYSFAFGYGVSAYANNSIVMGSHFLESGSNGEFLIGRSNSPATYNGDAQQDRTKAFTVGNGVMRFGMTDGSPSQGVNFSDAFIVLQNGKVGVDIDMFDAPNTIISDAKFQVNGAIKIGDNGTTDNNGRYQDNTTLPCNAINEGSIRYRKIDTTNGLFEGCKQTNGTFSWVTLN